MLPKDMYAAVPPPVKKVGKRPSLLTDEKVKILLSQPETWFVIGQSKTWISGVKANIENMKQSNISHLSDKGWFEIQQRKNKDGQIDIYCRFVKSSYEEE
jgi:hypothetical protein